MPPEKSQRSWPSVTWLDAVVCLLAVLPVMGWVERLARGRLCVLWLRDLFFELLVFVTLVPSLFLFFSACKF